MGNRESLISQAMARSLGMDGKKAWRYCPVLP
jgi:hypothetical protein